MLFFKVILVEPKYSGNIGSVSRVMKNFGFKDLILVSPCVLDNQTRMMSMHAYDIIKNAKIVKSLEQAVSDSNLIIGTTGIRGKTENRHIRMPIISPKKLKNKLNGKNGTISLLFGREDDGLRNNELEICDILISIQTSEEYPSMNLSHAVAVVLYELSDITPENTFLAKHFDINLLYEHIKELLIDIEYPEHKREKTILMIKRILGRAELTSREVQTLRGVLRKIQWKLKNS